MEDYRTAGLRAQAANAQGYSSVADTFAPAPPPSLTSDVGQRLETLTMLIADTGGDLAALSDRLFGAVPRGIAGASNAAKPMGQAGELVAVLDALIEHANYVRDEARSLNSRV